MEDESKSDKIIKECNQIIELWRLGKNDQEIRKDLGLSPQVFILRLNRIREDNEIATETMLFFEKEAIRLHDLYSRALRELDSVSDQRLVAPLIRCLVDIRKTYVDTAQRLGAVDPQRFVIEHLTKEQEEVKNLSAEELTQRYFNQLNKVAPTAH